MEVYSRSWSCVKGMADIILRPILVGRDISSHILVLLSSLGGFMMFGMDGFVTGPNWQYSLLRFGNFYG
jgi:predicted PurR-regulated permease PerM